MGRPSKEQRAEWKASGKKLAARDRVVHADERRDKRREDLLYLCGGAALALFGAGLTFWSYRAGGDQTFVVWGPFVVGIILMLKGLTGMR